MTRLMSKSALLLSISATSLAGCAGTPVVTATPSSCATLLPPEWKQGVAGAPLPQGDTVADWEVFADAQTGKLDQANGRTVDAIGIVERCEARDAAAIKKATHRFLGIF
jgi:hypothetical protein